MYFRNEHHRQAFRDGMKKTKNGCIFKQMEDALEY